MKNNPITEADREGATNISSMRGNLNPMYGKQHTEETKEAIRHMAIGRKMPDDWGKKHAEKLRGKKHTLESRLKRGMKGEANPMYGKHWSEEQKLQRVIKQGMRVTIDGIVYNSKREAAKLLGVSRPTIDNWIKNGQ